MAASVKERNTNLDPLAEEFMEDLPQEDKNDKKDKKKDKKDKKKKKSGVPVVAIVVLLLIIGAIVALLVFDLFGFRERHIMPYVREVPLVGSFFPAPEDAEAPEDEYAGVSREELISMITAYELQIQTMELADADSKEQAAQLQETINYLRGFEAQIEAYRVVKEQFDQMVALGDPEAYRQFYESISPENQDRLYQAAANEAAYDEEFNRYAATFAAMDATIAAESLGRILSTNAPLLVRILNVLTVDERAAILDEMEASMVSRIARLLEPVRQELPAATAPPVPAAPVTATTPTAEEPPAEAEAETPTEEPPTETEPPATE